MSDDLITGWDVVKDNLPSDGHKAAALLFDYGDKLADALEAAKRENDRLKGSAARAIVLEEALTRLLNEAVLDGMESRAGWDCWMHRARAALAGKDHQGEGDDQPH